jgi:hypothetical protein
MDHVKPKMQKSVEQIVSARSWLVTLAGELRLELLPEFKIRSTAIGYLHVLLQIAGFWQIVKREIPAFCDQSKVSQADKFTHEPVFIQISWQVRGARHRPIR